MGAVTGRNRGVEMRRIVITGATGFLGRNLARSFLDRGYQVFAIVRPDSANLCQLPVHEHMTRVMKELFQYEAWADEIGQADGFFHFAWAGVNRDEIDSDAVQQKNIQNSMACIQGAKKMNCKVFFDAGSRVEYGVQPDGIMEESMECRPVNAYGRAKLEFYRQASCVCQELNIQYYHLRFFSVYGYGDHPWSIISTLARELPRGRQVALSACRHRWNFMYIRDAVDAVIAIYENDRYSFSEENAVSQIVNIAGADTRVLKEFVEEIHAIAGKGSLSYGEFVQGKEGALSVCPDISRLLRLAGPGWKEQYSFCRGIIETMEQERDAHGADAECGAAQLDKL